MTYNLTHAEALIIYFRKLIELWFVIYGYIVISIMVIS